MKSNNPCCSTGSLRPSTVIGQTVLAVLICAVIGTAGESSAQPSNALTAPNARTWRSSSGARRIFAAATNTLPRHPNPFSLVPSAAVLAEKGAHHRTWVLESTNTIQNGMPASPSSAASVIEMASGMHYFDGSSWVPSEPSFDVTERGFVAERLQTKIRLNPDLNVPGAVSLLTPDGIPLQLSPAGIGLYDQVSGRFALLATITNSTGALVETNRVLFENAFHGHACGSVLYTVKQGSFESDVLITGKLDPRAFGFSTNCLLQIITEAFDCPDPGADSPATGGRAEPAGPAEISYPGSR